MARRAPARQPAPGRGLRRRRRLERRLGLERGESAVRSSSAGMDRSGTVYSGLMSRGATKRTVSWPTGLPGRSTWPGRGGLVIGRQLDRPRRRLAGRFERFALLCRLGEGSLQRGRGVAAVLVHAPGELQQQLLRVDTRIQRLVADVAALDLARCRLGQAELELPLAQPNQALERHLDAATDQHLALWCERRGGGLERLQLPRVGGDDEAVAEHDGAVSLGGRDAEIAGLLAEGDDLENVEEGQILQVSGQAQEIIPRVRRKARRVRILHPMLRPARAVAPRREAVRAPGGSRPPCSQRHRPIDDARLDRQPSACHR